MPRALAFTVPPEQTATIIAAARASEEVIGVRVFRGASLHPPGDVVQVDATNRAAHHLLSTLHQKGLLDSEAVTLSTGEPSSMVAPGRMKVIGNDVSDATWEEMDATVRRSASKHANTVLMMVAAGGLAGMGLAINAIELVLAAMVIAAEFEPLAQIGLGLAAGRGGWRAGIVSAALGAGCMFTGALCVGLMLHLAGYGLPFGAGGFLPQGALVLYFVELNLNTVTTDALAAMAGALLVAANRSQLTAGISMALPIVPLTALPALALVAGDGALVRSALTRWSLDVVLVIVFAFIVFSWKRSWRLRRDIVN
jgi:hypothetical protein